MLAIRKMINPTKPTASTAADIKNIKIICVYKAGSKFSSSLKAVSKDFIEYSSSDDLIEKLEKLLP
jgi:hypothetical protein